MTTKVQSNLGRTDKDGEIDYGLNEAFILLHQVHDWREQVATVTDSLAEDATTILVAEVDHVWSFVLGVRLYDATDDSSYPLKIWSPQQFIRLWPDPTDNTKAAPSDCWIDYSTSGGATVRLQSPSDAAYTLLTLYNKEGTFAATGSPSLKGLDNFLTSYATYYVFATLEAYQQASWWLQKAQGELAILLKRDRRRPERVDKPEGWVSREGLSAGAIPTSVGGDILSRPFTYGI
jgi:hypothetical protein